MSNETTIAALRSAGEFTIGDWTVHPDVCELRRGAHKVHLPDKALHVLYALARRPGELVTKAELLDTVWAGRIVVEGVLKRCVSDLRQALGDDSRAPKFIETISRRGYRLIAPVEFRDQADRVEAAGPTQATPYLGLVTFDFDDAGIFFGREQASADIIAALEKQQANGCAFVVVLGMSGVGKSSVVRAGVLPRLQQAQDRRAAFRHSDTPGDLFDGLAASLLREEGIADIYAAGIGQTELAAALRTDPEHAIELIGTALRMPPEGGRLLLVIDQMEELFALKRVEPTERERFFELISGLARSGHTSVIATLRSDFYHRCYEINALVELKSGHGQYDLMPPSAAEIRQIIQRPATVAGVTFESEPDGAGSLDQAISDAAIGHAAALPLLEFTLQELYKRRNERNEMTFDAYRKLGGVEGCLGQRAEETYRDQPPGPKAALPSVLESLVAVASDDEAVFSSHPALRTTVCATRDSEELVDAFVEARLFTTHLAHDGKNRVVRIAHEALLAHWPRAQQWLHDNARFIRLHRRLGAAARRWDREQRHDELLLPEGWQLAEAESIYKSGLDLAAPEEEFLVASRARADKRRHRRTALLGTFTILAVTSIGALYLAAQNRQVAQAQAARAESEAQVASKTVDLLSNIFLLSDPGTSRSETITPQELLDEGAGRVETEFAGQPLIQATLLHRIGNVYRSRGLYDSALKAIDSSLAMRHAALGVEHPLVADTLADLAIVQIDRGDYEAAVASASQALDLRRATFGPTHEKVASSLDQLGWSLHPLGETDEAERLVAEGLEMRLALFSEDNVEIADSHKNLGLFMRARGELAGAETHMLRALEIRRKLLGNDHPDIGMSLNHLGGLYTVMKDYESAGRYSEEALALNRKLLGDDHPDVALSFYNLAGVMLRLEKFDRAQSLAQSSVDANVATLGADHPLVAITKGFLATILIAKRDYDAALIVADDAYEITKEALPDGHWRTAWIQAIRGGALAGVGRYAEAEPLLNGAYMTIREKRGAEDDATMKVLEYLNVLYAYSADPRGAAKIEQLIADAAIGESAAAPAP